MSAPRLDSRLDLSSDGAKARATHNRSLVDRLRADVARALLGGTDKARERHTARGNLLPRDIGAGTNEIRRMLIGRAIIGA